MAVVHKIQSETPLPGGEKMIRGTMTIAAYNMDTGSGVPCNLANFLHTSGYPTVVITSEKYNLQHDKGTAAAGRVVAYEKMYNNTANAFSQVTNNVTLSVNASFIAIGPAY